MIRSIILSMMGTWGLPVLNFYETNSLWINLLVLIYGAVIVLSWINLKNVRKSLVLSIVTQLRSRVDFSPEIPAGKALGSLTIPWDNAIRQVRFPLVAQQNGLLPHRLSVETVQAMLPTEELAGEALKVIRLQNKRAARKNP